MPANKPWIKRHTAALIVALLVTALSVIANLPPIERIFLLQRQFLAGMQYLCGPFDLPVILVARFIDAALPQALSLAVMILLFFVLGLFAGLLVEGVWRRGWLARVLLLVVLAINLVIGQFSVAWGDTLVGPPSGRCEKYFSESRGLRIAAYPEQGIIPGTHLFFSATQDGGRTWRQFMYYRYDDPLTPDCEKSGSLSPDHFWIWIGWQAAVTQDGGRTWHTWQPKQTWPDWQCCNYSLVQEIRFSDGQNGEMRLDPIPGRGETSALQTADGGRTWR